MSTHKYINKICCVGLIITLICTLVFMNADELGIKQASTSMGYEDRLFDTSRVHTIDIVMDDWDDFIENCEDEEYSSCSLVIDNEAYKNVAIRAKGNTSLTQVSSYGNDRYSFKIEFDHYDSNKTYYGLDKLCLNNIIQDNTYMKDYLAYQMMADMGVASPLCSYVYITVNGEDWGLYLAVEAVEDSFLARNYGSSSGELYKPDSSSMGGGRGNGENFRMDEDNDDNQPGMDGNQPGMNGNQPGMDDNQPGMDGNDTDDDNTTSDVNEDNLGENNANFSTEQQGPGADRPDMDDNQPGMNGGGTTGSDDVLLKYIDDDPDSYPNIFDNAKTDVSDSDKERLIASLKNLSEGTDIEDTVDVDSVIKYFVVHNFLLNFDSYTGSMIHNYYLYEDDGILQMIPWDYNLSFGGFQNSGDATALVNYPIDTPVSGGSIEDRPMLAWIFANEEYTELYHQYFEEFISEYFDSGYFEEMIDTVTELISPYVEEDPTSFCTYEEFQTGVSTLKEFCLLRAESITKQLDGTIGSTSDTQDTSTFVNADDIQISDMGSMNGGGQGGPGGQNGGEQGGRPDEQNDGNQGNRPDGQNDGNQGNRPDGQNNGNQNSSPGEQNNGQTDGSPGGNMQPPNMGDMQDGDFQTSDKDDMPTGTFQAPDDNDQNTKPDVATASDATRPGMNPGSTSDSSVPTSTYITLSICVAVLIAGLIFAFVFRRRKRQRH